MKLRTISAVVAALCLGGCAIEPWVKPYERGWLADPLMSVSRDPLSDKYLQHVQVKEAKNHGRKQRGKSRQL